MRCLRLLRGQYKYQIVLKLRPQITKLNNSSKRKKKDVLEVGSQTNNTPSSSLKKKKLRTKVIICRLPLPLPEITAGSPKTITKTIHVIM